MIKRIRALMSEFHRCEAGAQGLEKLLLLAALILPLLGILIFYGGEIRDWLVGLWEDMRGQSEDLREPR